jgi:hypothetical protein
MCIETSHILQAESKKIVISPIMAACRDRSLEIQSCVIIFMLHIIVITGHKL